MMTQNTKDMVSHATHYMSQKTGPLIKPLHWSYLRSFGCHETVVKYK